MSRRRSTPTATTPFQNLRFFIFIVRVMGMISCKLINGRLKQSSVWNRCYCLSWILLHCTYTSIFYYQKSIESYDSQADIYFILSIVRYTAFFISLPPYHWVTVSQSRDFIQFSDKLEAYDDKAAEFGHRRKDNHIFTWLYFAYTLCTLATKTYYSVTSCITDEALITAITIVEAIVPTFIGTYCVFITGIYLDMIRQRFHHLNETIVPHVAQLPVSGSLGEITIYDVRYLHGVLVDSAKLIDNLYGFGTLLTFASMLLEFVAVIYLSLEKISGENVLLTSVDLLFQVIYLFAMYHFTTFEANRVEERVAQYGLSFQNAKCRMDKIEVMLYFYHNRFYFTAAQFFILDLTVLLSISTTVTTFLTIMV